MRKNLFLMLAITAYELFNKGPKKSISTTTKIELKAAAM
jgi:hypothetical protein